MGQRREQDIQAVKWRIYYGDGKTFSASDGRPEEAPGRNVQVILQDSADVGVRVLSDKDFYLFVDGEWIGVDLIGLMDHLEASGMVKVGRTLTSTEYQKVLGTALAEYDERKSGWLPIERRP